MTRRLLYLNGLAVLGVVLNHALSWSFVAMFWWTDRYRPVSVPNFDQLGGATYWVLRVVEQLIIFTIPTFLFVSGYFVAFAAGKAQARVNPRFIWNRLQYLIIPYVLWSVIMLAFEYAQGNVYTLAEYARMLLLGGTTPAFYFVPLLAQLYLLAFVMVPLAKRHWRVLLAGAALLQVLVQVLRYAVILRVAFPGREVLQVLTPGWFFPGSVFWFALGIVVGFHLAALKQALARWRWVFVGGLGALLVLGILEWELLLRWSGEAWLTPKETLLDNLYALCFLMCFIAFDAVRLPAARRLSELGPKSFGVYLVHSLVLIVVARLTYHVAPWVLGYQWLFLPLLFVAGLGVPLLLMAIVIRSPAKRIYAYQFG